MLTRIHGIRWLGTPLHRPRPGGGSPCSFWPRRQPGAALEALVGGTLLLTNTFLWACHGAEEAEVVVCLLLLAARWGEGRPLLAGATAGFAAWCRPDAGLAVDLLG